MAFRTIIVENRCKLEYSLNYLVCRKLESETKVLLDEIKLLIIDSTQVSITTSLLSELINKKIKVIFTDNKHNPIGELTPYQNNYYSYRKIKEQMEFSQESKDLLWKYIIERKIINQKKNLLFAGKYDAADMLDDYYNDVQIGDKTNREGHSAKVYFNSLFGNDFNRGQNNDINMYLNYGYSILLSSLNRDIKTLGYLTEIGIHHIGESNSFNLSCDLMEPLRPLVDSYIIKGLSKDNFKKTFIDMLSIKVTYCKKEFYLDNAIKLYVEDMFNYLKTGDMYKIRFIDYEL